MYSVEQLANDFRRLGIRAGDTVMLHASVRAVGEVAGGPGAIHLAVKSTLTPEGTLMMYAKLGRRRMVNHCNIPSARSMALFNSWTA